MADEADLADIQQQLILDAQIAAAKGKPLDTSNPSGECWYCFDMTGYERRFCDAQCCAGRSKDNEL